MEKIKILNEAGNITRNLDNPPLKDTVSVPDAGFSLIRFVANNPGFWIIHSTTTWFHYMGMEIVLQVRSTYVILTSTKNQWLHCIANGSWVSKIKFGILQVGERNEVESDIPDGFPTCDNFSYEWNQVELF